MRGRWRPRSGGDETKFDAVNPLDVLARERFAHSHGVFVVGRRLRVGLLVVLGTIMLYGGLLEDLVRFCCALVGLLAGPLLTGARHRAHRGQHGHRLTGTRREGRVLVAIVVAASALGPILAAFFPTAVGPLSVLRFLFTSAPPDADTVRAICLDPTTAMETCRTCRIGSGSPGWGPPSCRCCPHCCWWCCLTGYGGDGGRPGRRRWRCTCSWAGWVVSCCGRRRSTAPRKFSSPWRCGTSGSSSPWPSHCWYRWWCCWSCWAPAGCSTCPHHGAPTPRSQGRREDWSPWCALCGGRARPGLRLRPPTRPCHPAARLAATLHTAGLPRRDRAHLPAGEPSGEGPVRMARGGVLGGARPPGAALVPAPGAPTAPPHTPTTCSPNTAAATCPG